MIEFLIAVEVKKIIQTRRSTEGASVERVERHVRKSAGLYNRGLTKSSQVSGF